MDNSILMVFINYSLYYYNGLFYYIYIFYLNVLIFKEKYDEVMKKRSINVWLWNFELVKVF